MIPILASPAASYDVPDIGIRILPVAATIAQRVCSIINPYAFLLGKSYTFSYGSVNKTNIDEYLRSFAKFSIYTDGGIVFTKKLAANIKSINTRLGYQAVSETSIKLHDYYKAKYFFNPNAAVDVELFNDLIQHFTNYRDLGSVNYSLEGKLAGLDDILTPHSFRGDPLSQAVKAKVFIELLMIDQDAANNARMANGNCIVNPEDGEEGVEQQSDSGNSDENEDESLYEAVKRAHHHKEMFDKNGGFKRTKDLEDNDIQKPDLLESISVEKFNKDTGILSEKKIDLSFDHIYKSEEERNRNGEMRLVPNKTFNLKGVPKSSLAHPTFKNKHASRRLYKRDYYKKITKNELIVFILVDVSGSMNTLGKIRVRNAIIMDRFKAVMKNRCQLYVEGYLSSRTNEMVHIKDTASLNQWIYRRPSGGNTDVKKSVHQLMNTEPFKKCLADGLKGEIILINDGQDKMPPFVAPNGVRIHAMQLADVEPSENEQLYINQDLVAITEKNNGKYIFFDTY